MNFCRKQEKAGGYLPFFLSYNDEDVGPEGFEPPTYWV
jgi:hypothetical protein